MMKQSEILMTGKIMMMAILLFGMTAFANTYKVDFAHSKVGFKIKHLMISNVVGYFEKFEGSYDYDPKTGMLKSLEGLVNVKSINTSVVKRDNDLRSDNFFNAEKYPQMKLKMTKFDANFIYVDLTIKDVTKNVKFEYESGGAVKDPWGNQRSAFSLEGKISREEFGITYNKVLEAGGVMIGDKVKINIEIEGIQK